MATVTTRYTVNTGNLERTLTGAAMSKYLSALGRDIAAACIQEAPRGETGGLQADIGFQVVNGGSRQVRLLVGHTAKLRVPWEGHGLTNRALFTIYGHGVIRPRKAKVLRFPVRGGQIVWAREVRAVGPNDYLSRGLNRVMSRQ